MHRPYLAFLLVVIAFLAAAGPAASQGTSVTPSLKVTEPALYLLSGGVLNATAPTRDSACDPTLLGSIPSTPSSPAFSAGIFKLPTPPSTGAYWLSQPTKVTIAYNASGTTSGVTGTLGQPGQPATAGATVKVELKFGDKVVANGTKTLDPGAPQPSSIDLVAPPGVPIIATGAAFTLVVTFTATTPGAQNLALACGSHSSIEKGLVVVKGQPGEGDLDGDGIPDSEDSDIDGDGIPNSAEPSCSVNGKPVDFVHTPAKNPGSPPGTNSDHDGDGFTDQRECAAGTDPLDALSYPPPPPEFPWGLVILGLIVLIALALLVGWLTVFGRAAAVKIVSAPELIVPAGTTGRFQLTVENLRKKGNPINFQLSAGGMPEGWDAKLQPGNALLDPVGGAKSIETVWLTVEAPNHTEPESAVVKVRAIALTAAGKKDTLKLPAVATTVTSVNVPPNAKVPVRRGEDVKLKSEKELAAEAGLPPPAEGGVPPPPAAAPSTIWREKDRPVVDIEGVGATYAAGLDAMGLRTVQRLHAADAAAVAKGLGTDETTVRQWQEMAELVDVKGVGPQVAELLVRSGVHSIAALAQSDVKELAATIERTNADRKVAIQGGPAGLKSVKNWTKAAQKHPLADRPVATRPPEALAPPTAKGKAKEAEPEAAPPTPAPPGKPNVQVGGLQHNPPTFAAGQNVKSTVTVTNGGTSPQTIKLSLFVNDALADAQTVSVKAGKAKDVTFKWQAQERNKLNIRGELVAA